MISSFEFTSGFRPFLNFPVRRRAAVAQILLFDPKTGTFKVLASAGNLITKGASPSETPKLSLSTESLTAVQPVFVRQLLNEPRMRDQAWIERERMASYAAYPLLVEGRLVGLMSIFSRQILQEEVCQEMGSVSHGISLCIERKRSEQALDASEVKYR